MTIGVACLIIGFLILVSVLLWMWIKDSYSLASKAFLIPAIVLYGAVLFLAPDYLAGWPTQQKFPESGFILSYQVQETKAGKEGFIYLWLLEDGLVVPRAFSVPYNLKLHKELIKAKKQKDSRNGIMRFGRKTGRGIWGFGRDSGDDFHAFALIPQILNLKP